MIKVKLTKKFQLKSTGQTVKLRQTLNIHPNNNVVKNNNF